MPTLSRTSSKLSSASAFWLLNLVYESIADKKFRQSSKGTGGLRKAQTLPSVPSKIDGPIPSSQGWKIVAVLGVKRKNTDALFTYLKPRHKLLLLLLFLLLLLMLLLLLVLLLMLF